MYTVLINDSIRLENLVLNGNNFISTTKIEASIFPTNTFTATIINHETNITETYECAELVQVQQYNNEWWFILRELSIEERQRKQIIADIEMNLELTANQEYRICLMELGVTENDL